MKFAFHPIPSSDTWARDSLCQTIYFTVSFIRAIIVCARVCLLLFFWMVYFFFNNSECLISWRDESTSAWRDSGMSAISEAFHAQKLHVKCFPSSARVLSYPRISAKPRRSYRGVCRRWRIFIATMTYAATAVSTRDSYFTAGGRRRRKFPFRARCP